MSFFSYWQRLTPRWSHFLASPKGIVYSCFVARSKVRLDCVLLESGEYLVLSSGNRIRNVFVIVRTEKRVVVNSWTDTLPNCSHGFRQWRIFHGFLTHSSIKGQLHKTFILLVLVTVKHGNSRACLFFCLIIIYNNTHRNVHDDNRIHRGRSCDRRTCPTVLPGMQMWLQCSRSRSSESNWYRKVMNYFWRNWESPLALYINRLEISLPHGKWNQETNRSLYNIFLPFRTVTEGYSWVSWSVNTRKDMDIRRDHRR